MFHDDGVFLDVPTQEVRKVLADHVVARLSVRPGEECSLLGDTEAAFALADCCPDGAFQVSVLHHLYLSSNVFLANAFADVEPVMTASPFQLAQV